MFPCISSKNQIVQNVNVFGPPSSFLFLGVANMSVLWLG